ncbi:MAG: hypothetical protein FJY65_11870 [Calditrichaeota bacterium]|nr:hypothetical protein [Calditrichota bacterium]
MFRSIQILDSSVYLIILKVPKHSGVQDEPGVYNYWHKVIEDAYINNDRIIIPLGVIVEVGNHIGSALNGRKYEIIDRFISDVSAALDGEKPYSIGELPDADGLRRWLISFKDQALSNVEFGDLTCIEEFNKCLKLFPNKPIMIWSTDEHLKSYKYEP